MEEFVTLIFFITGLVLSFNIGVVMDGLLLKRNQASTCLTIIGWVFFGALFLFINAFLNLVSALLFLGKTHGRHVGKWRKFLLIPSPYRFVGFMHAMWFFLVEIIISISLGYLSTPFLLGLVSHNYLLMTPLFFITISCFVILFFRLLPYKNKSLWFKVSAWLVLVISSGILFYLLSESPQNVSLTLSNITTST